MGMVRAMNDITLTVERDEESGWYTAHWDSPDGSGGITTQGKDLADLQANIREAVHCHFENGTTPRVIRLHFITDPVLAVA
jgi:predicted RNase H-like HicB family nuclease